MLEIRSLRKSFGALVAVDDVSFTVERGQRVGLLGPNGAGKTTTVSMIAGVARPDGGDVLIDGRPLAGDADPAKRHLGLVPQELALCEELTARDNLAVTAGSNIAYNGYAHAFAGMGIQFLLFATANLGIVDILLERQRGLWRRLRSAPVSRLMLLAGKTVSMMLVALMTLLVSFGFAIVVFRVRIQGSLLGSISVAIACSLMAATFGLLIAAIGRTPAATRGVTTLAVLMMVTLGGAWVPTSVFPACLQHLTVVVPARWAVDGLDVMTSRGSGGGAP